MSKITKLIILTDIHILHNDGNIIGINPLARLRQAIAHINRTQMDADLVIFTGDLTHHGEPKAYEIFKDEIAKLKLPCKLLIGNHDKRANFQSAFPRAEKDVNGFVQWHQDFGHWRVIGLDSVNDPPLPDTRHGAGQLCTKRLEYLTETMAASGGKKIALFMHHHPFVSRFSGMDQIRLLDAPRFAAALAGRNVRFLGMGHIHRFFSVAWQGIMATVFKSTVDQLPFDLETNDTALGTREAPGYGVVLLDDEQVIVHNVDYLTELSEEENGGAIRHT